MAACFLMLDVVVCALLQFDNFVSFIMTKIDTRKILFTLSGIALITLLSLFIQNYVHASPKEGEKFGSWVVACEKGEKNKKICFLSQSVVRAAGEDQKSVQTIATFNLGYFGGSKELQMIEILPFGVNLQSGSTIILPENKLIAPGIFTTCQNFGCIAVAKISNKDLDEIASAKEAFVGILSAEGKQINIKIEPKGLKEGVAALKAS
jgi:invasion protein IalB